MPSANQSRVLPKCKVSMPSNLVDVVSMVTYGFASNQTKLVRASSSSTKSRVVLCLRNTANQLKLVCVKHLRVVLLPVTQ
ncbi:hypothetical protein D9M68_711090 [compost metagenome]